MAILYDFYASPSVMEEGAKEQAKEQELATKYHARVVGGQTLDVKKLVSRISQRSTLGEGDVLAVFHELSDELSQELLAGNRVYFPEIGYFSLSLQAPAEADPKETRAQKIRVKRIEFRAETQLRKKVESHAVFERSSKKMHSARLSHEEVESKVLEYLKEHMYVTCRTVCECCHLTKGTAQNHLKRMLAEGKIVNTNTPRNPIYMVAKDKVLSHDSRILK